MGRETLTDELRRERLLDIEARLRRFRIPVFVALGIWLIASGPWLGWLWIGPLVPAIGVPVRAFDLIYRLGGEEFVVLLPGAEMGDALEIAERLRAAVEAARPEGLELTLSVGVAVASGSALDFDRLYERADAALYGAKQARRNCVRVAEGASPLKPLALARTA